jgi:hypothetical protein
VCGYAAPQDSNLPGVTVALATNWTEADFDGDHKPDLALSRSIAQRSNHLYEIDLRLTSGPRAGSLSFSNPKELELDVHAVDLDGDNDLDLVVTDRFLGETVGIWINDGTGSFSRSPSRVHPGCLQKLSRSYSDPGPLIQTAENKSSHRSVHVRGAKRFSGAPLLISELSRHNLRAPVSTVQYGSCLLRAPPSAI